ncbi:MAG: hypothetical protein IT362_02075 [Deltaproteobacteria bacterium]|nr:hypothetical protein [Deltaproteobacteria bacterium]
MQRRTTTIMTLYRIKLRITEPSPEKLGEKKLSLNGSEVTVTTWREPPSIEIFPIQSDNHEIAMLIARRAINNLLNYFASVVQFRGTLETGYEYASLDHSNKGGTVIQVGTGFAYCTKVDVPDGFSLNTERRAAAFLRQGDSSNNPFESFRNYYLSVDSIGKAIKPALKDSEVILKTLTDVASTKVISELETKLNLILPELCPSSLSPVETINLVIYKSFRCSLMHSGSTNDFTPFNPEDELQVIRALPIMRGIAWQYVKYERDKLIKTV